MTADIYRIVHNEQSGFLHEVVCRECAIRDYCEHQVEDNYDDYLKELEDGCYE